MTVWAPRAERGRLQVRLTGWLHDDAERLPPAVTAASPAAAAAGPLGCRASCWLLRTGCLPQLLVSRLHSRSRGSRSAPPLAAQAAMLHPVPPLASMLRNSLTPGGGKSYRMWTGCSRHRAASCAAASTLGPVCDPADGFRPCQQYIPLVLSMSGASITESDT